MHKNQKVLAPNFLRLQVWFLDGVTDDKLEAVLRIRIRIRMNPHDFGLLDPHPESAFQMRILDADADPE